MPSAETVIFAIRAGLRLGHEARRAYIDKTKQHELVLSLPSVNLMPDVVSAMQFFVGDGAVYVEEGSRLKEVHDSALAGGLTQDDERQYLDLYEQMFAFDQAKRGGQSVRLSDGTAIDPGAFNALVTYRQWTQQDGGRPQPLRRAIGTVIELGIEYFATVPGALNTDSPHGKALAGFVSALDQIDFSQLLLDEDAFGQLAGQLFLAAMETLSAQPEVISSDQNVQELVTIATKGLSFDVANRLNELQDDQAKQDRLKDWANLVLRSLLSAAGRQVVAEPARFLGVDDEPQGVLITNVGQAFIDLAIEHEDLNLKRMFGREGLDTLMQATLEAIGEHPDLIADTDNAGVKVLISQIASTLGGFDTLLTADIVPQAARMILEKTGQNLELIWPALKPDTHLLLTAAKTTLDILSKQPPAAAKWRLTFGRSDVLSILDTVLDEMANNPAWLVAATEDMDENLGAALAATLQVLRKRADNRLSPVVASEILSEAIRAVALRQEFLDDTIAGGRPLVASVVDVVISSIFDSDLEAKVQWELLGSQTIITVVELALQKYAGSRMDKASLTALKNLISATVQDITDGKPFDGVGFETALSNVLTAA